MSKINLKNLSLEEKLKLIAEKDKICDKVAAGEKVPCPECGAILVEITPWGKSTWADDREYWSGHGVFCPKDEDHFSRIITYSDSKKQR